MPTEKQMRDELTQLVEAIDDAFDQGTDPADWLDVLRPVIADAAASPNDFRRDVHRAIDAGDEDWIDELTAQLDEQIANANAEQIAEYYQRFSEMLEAE